MAGITFDTGVLIGVERADPRTSLALERAVGYDRTIPTAVIAQAWRGPRSARVALLIRGCRVEPLTEELARAAGELLARSGMSDAIDAIVVASAATRGDIILTSDPSDLRRLAGFAHDRVRIVAL